MNKKSTHPLITLRMITNSLISKYFASTVAAVAAAKYEFIALFALCEHIVCCCSLSLSLCIHCILCILLRCATDSWFNNLFFG